MAERFSNSKTEDSDHPPMSRLFIICDKSQTEDDIRRNFQKYGKIEDIWIVKSKTTGEKKGVVYVKFSKTSEAALAQEEMDGKLLGDSERPIKVVVAAKREEGSRREKDEDHDKYVRLFVVVPKEITEDELSEEFKNFGPVENVQIVKDRATREPKGVAYVRFKRFYHAALAFEKCSAKYKAVFATPKSAKNTENPHTQKHENGNVRPTTPQMSGLAGFLNPPNSSNQSTALHVICSNQVTQDQLWRLFDIVPGLDYCKIEREEAFNFDATVVYVNKESAEYAKQKIHGLEYPPGNRLIVKFDEAVGTASSKSSSKPLCNVDLPPSQPLADANIEVAKRCFIVVSAPIPSDALKQVFSSFGNLIDVYLLANKNCGYAKYAKEESATRAMEVLNGAEIRGVRVKVIEAEERPSSRKRMRSDD